MANFIAFINSFLSYLLVFGIVVVLGITACFAGVKFRKHKDEKLAAEETELNNAQ